MDGAPPSPPVVKAPACALSLTQAEADLALQRISGGMTGTHFERAWPSCLPGMVALKIKNGETAYTDKFGRYLVFGLIFDTTTGTALDRQMDGLKE
jgi:hypothetical protein